MTTKYMIIIPESFIWRKLYNTLAILAVCCVWYLESFSGTWQNYVESKQDVIVQCSKQDTVIYGTRLYKSSSYEKILIYTFVSGLQDGNFFGQYRRNLSSIFIIFGQKQVQHAVCNCRHNINQFNICHIFCYIWFSFFVCLRQKLPKCSYRLDTLARSTLIAIIAVMFDNNSIRRYTTKCFIV